MNDITQPLAERCERLLAGAGTAIDWIDSVRPQAPRLDREADSLISALRRARNLSRRLGRACQRPVSVGFFGLSQAGKSYLISALAAGKNGELETVLDNERLNFISHINPPGHGKEATGLVTRFTRQEAITPPGFPIVLSLCAEVELVKILGNAFFNDFDREQVAFNTDPSYIRGQLNALATKRQPRPTGGVTEDDVLDLLDYFEKRFRKSMEPLLGDYWPTAVTLAPYLAAPDRATLFSILWGELDDLSAIYLKLRDALSTTGYAQTVYCPTGALVSRTPEGDWTQADSIMNVDILERLGRDDHDRIEVVPVHAGQTQKPVALPRSLLAALTAELQFVLADPPLVDTPEPVDLLDFPGYRGRLSISKLDEVRKQLKDEQVDPVAQLVLRGKVAYLFERYTEDHALNALVLCTPCHKQMDVQSLGPVLEQWIHATQGATPAARAQRPPGLIWAVTMFDMRLAPAPGQTLDTLRIGWEGMMKMILLERFGQYGWVHEWSPGRAFANFFLVRKPQMASSIIATRGGIEREILPEQTARLEQLRETFLQDPSVRKHIREPEQAWNAMLAFNDGGISRLAEYLGAVAKQDTQRAQIQARLDAVIEDIAVRRLGHYYRSEGAAEVEHKKRLGGRVIEALRKRPARFGELLYALQPSSERLRSLYLRAEEAPADSPDTVEQNNADTGGGLIDLDFAALTAAADSTPKATTSTSATRFVQAALRDWIAQLKELPAQADTVSLLGLSKNILEDISDELITAADRLKLEDALLAAIQEAEERTSATRARLVERQVFAVRMQLCEFVDRLGFGTMPPAQRPASLVDPNRPIFQPPPPVAVGELPRLTPKPINFSGLVIVDWFEAFRQLSLDNAGHDTGREISTQQNARLGEILGTMGGAAVSLSKA